MLLNKPVDLADVPHAYASYLALTRSAMMMFYFMASPDMNMYLASILVYFFSELHALYIFDTCTTVSLVSTGLQTLLTLIISFTL